MANPTVIRQKTASELSVAVLEEGDLDAADHIFRLAFGTFLGLPDPMAFAATADLDVFLIDDWR